MQPVVVGSLNQLQEYVPKSGNTYHIMRHGEASHNVNGLMSSLVTDKHDLTDKGKKDVQTAIEKLKEKNIDLLYVSPMHRTQVTAAMVAEGLELSEDKIITDERHA